MEEEEIQIATPEDEAAARFEAAVNGKLVDIEGAYETAMQLPVTYTTVGGVTAQFQANVDSQAVLQTTLIGLPVGVVPPGFWWLSVDNTQVPFTYADLKGLAFAMLSQGWAAFQAKQAKKSALREASTVEEVELI